MGDVLQVSRQIRILELLADNPKGLTVKEIYNYIECYMGQISIRTIRRDIEQLSCSYDIQELNHSIPIKYALKTFNLKSLKLTSDDIYALTMTQIMLRENLIDPVHIKAISILEKIIRASTQLNKIKIQEMKNYFMIRKTYSSEKDIDSKKVDMILSAMNQNKVLKIVYHGFNSDTSTQRTIEPYFFLIQEGKLHLIAFCKLRNEVRDFRVSRIISIKKSDESFIKREKALQNYEKRRFVNLSGTVLHYIVVIFNKNMRRYIEEYEKEKAKQILILDNGSIQFEIESAITDELVRWILGFGADIEVISPIELKNRVILEIEKTGNLYK